VCLRMLLPCIWISFFAMLSNWIRFTRLRTGLPGRQYGLASLNRAAVVMSVSAWESYVEELMRESLAALRPVTAHPGNWPALSAFIQGELGRFNTPNSQNVANLINRCIGLANVRTSWTWRNSTSAQVEAFLNDSLALRHEIAHGVNPRPVIHYGYSSRLPGFIRHLARCTDDAVRDHLTTSLGLTNPWPA
jgi:hypothetical protein